MDEPEEQEEPEEEPVTEVVDDLDELNGVGPTYRKLLRAAGVTSKAMLVAEDPEALYQKLMAINDEQEITKRPPTQDNIVAWINLSK